MEFISEAQIEEAAELLQESEEAYQEKLEALQQEQPALLAYFFTENFEAFTQEEREYLLFLLLVIWAAVKHSGAPLVKLTEKEITDCEEYNWSLLQGAKGSSFHERLNVFFEAYPQEDLLAFAEDALSEEDEDGPVSREGREALFVCLKTAIDGLAQVAPPSPEGV